MTWVLSTPRSRPSRSSTPPTWKKLRAESAHVLAKTELGMGVAAVPAVDLGGLGQSFSHLHFAATLGRRPRGPALAERRLTLAAPASQCPGRTRRVLCGGGCRRAAGGGGWVVFALP